MDSTKSVFITGDKTTFISKGAVKRFKNDIRSSSNPNELDASKYFDPNYTFTCSITDNTYNIEIVHSEKFKQEQRRELLRERLRNSRYSRSGKPKQKLNSLKRSVPDKIFKAYYNLMKTYQFNIPPPDEVINDVEKHRMQISIIAGSYGKVSNDDKANNAIKRYYRILADFLGIEPMDIKVPTQPPAMNSVPNIPNVPSEQINSDTEDEEEPDLVEIN